MKNLKLLLFTFCIQISLAAQTEFKGIILDSISQQPIDFVNIGVLENTNGTVSNSDGVFILKEDAEHYTVRFSSIGYFEKTISLQELQLNNTIYLQPQTYKIKPIQIESKQFGIEKIKGKKVKSKNSIYGWDWSEQMGREIGIRIKIKEESFIKSAHFGLHKNSTDSILLRVNIYEYKNGEIGKNLMPENVFIKTGDIDKYLSVDLTKFNIVVDDDVLLALELVEEVSYEKEQTLLFRIQLRFKTNILERVSKQDEFEKLSIPKMGFIKPQVGFYLTVKEAK